MSAHHGCQTPSTHFTPPQSPTRSIRQKFCSKFSTVSEQTRMGAMKSLPKDYNVNILRRPNIPSISNKEDESVHAQWRFQQQLNKVHDNYISHDDTQRTYKDTQTGSQTTKMQCFGYIIGRAVIILLSGILGAFCYACVQQYLRESHQDPKSTDIACVNRQSQTDVQLHELSNSMLQIGKELNSIREMISQRQVNYSDVIPKIPRGILEELFAGKPDLVCSGNLGSVLATPDTVTHTVPTHFSVLGMLSLTLQLPHKPPDTTIKGLIQEVGDCWAFSGERGRLVLALHRPSAVSSVSLSHIPSTLSLTGDITTAPRHFHVMGHQLEEDLDSGLLLGVFEYSSAGPWRQTFIINPLIVKEELFKAVEFQFISNHGHPNYTCIYRVHVHGKMF